MTIDTKNLRTLAEAADQIGAGWVQHEATPNYIHSVFPFGDDYLIANVFDRSCADYIAAANPQTILALLDEIEILQGRNTALDRERNTFADALERKDRLLWQALEDLTYHTAQTRPIVNTNECIAAIRKELT